MQALGTAVMLAHQGGWDEMLMVAVPVAVFAGLLYAANRRAGRMDPAAASGAVASGTADGDDTDPVGDAPRATERRAHNASEFGTRPSRTAADQSSRSTSAPTERNRSTKPS